jgi:hypothetical protein
VTGDGGHEPTDEELHALGVDAGSTFPVRHAPGRPGVRR